MEYGHRHLGLIYRPLFDLKDDGLIYHGKFYAWAEIKKIKRYDNSFWSSVFYQGGAPLTYIYLADGKIIKIRAAALEVKGQMASKSDLIGRTEVYETLIKTIEKKKEAV